MHEMGATSTYNQITLSGDRCKQLQSNGTSKFEQTAEWVARQVTEAFPWDEAPQYLIRDRDRIYGAITIPWQKPPSKDLAGSCCPIIRLGGKSNRSSSSAGHAS
jgi:hypothetical protein